MEKAERLIRVAIIMVAALAAVMMPLPVHADQPDPDSVTIDDIHINRSLLHSNDILLYFTPNVAYAAGPDTPIDDAFDFRLIDTDNVTVLFSREAYDFANDGYGPTLVSFYADNATAPTWGEEYIIRITGKPSVFDDPPVYDFPIAASDYTSETTQEANQSEVRANIISIARSLSTSMSVDLLEETDVGTVLSAYGEEFFRNAIPGLQAMVPDLFQVVIYQPNYTPRDWTNEQSDNYSGTYSGTAEGSASSGFWGSMIGINFSLGMAMPVVIGCILFIVASVKVNSQPFSGFLNSAAAIIISGPAGIIPMAIVSIGATLMGFYSSIRLWLKG